MEDSRQTYVRTHICTAVGQEMGFSSTETMGSFQGRRQISLRATPKRGSGKRAGGCAQTPVFEFPRMATAFLEGKGGGMALVWFGFQ